MIKKVILYDLWLFFLIYRRFNECLKDKETGAGLEASCSSLCDSLRQILQLTCLDPEMVRKGVEAASVVTSQVQTSLKDFTTFLKVKAICNFTLGSYPLTLPS